MRPWVQISPDNDNLLRFALIVTNCCVLQCVLQCVEAGGRARGEVLGPPHCWTRCPRCHTITPAPIMSLLLLLRLLLLLLCSLPQQTRAARVASREAPRVQISNQGWVAGREIFVTRTQRARQYLGIPFAQPPVGPLRLVWYTQVM